MGAPAIPPSVMSAKAIARAGGAIDRLERLRSAMASALVYNPVDGAVMSSPPTVTAQTGNTSGLSTTLRPYNTNLFRMIGATPIVYATTGWRGGSVSRPSGGNVSTTRDNSSWRIAFLTDAPSIDILMTGMSSSRVRFLIDGQYINKAGHDYAATSGAANFNLAFGTRALRRIEVEAEDTAVFYGVNITAGDSLAQAPAPKYRLGVFGDSITRCTGTLRRWDGWANRAAMRLGGPELEMVNLGLSGTGYANNGTNVYTFEQHVSDAAGLDEIWIAGGVNDGSYTQSQQEAAALSFYRAVRALLANAPIIVFGSFANQSGTSSLATSTATEGYLRNAFTAWADPNSVFIPILSAERPVQSGTAAAPTSGNFQHYAGGTTGTDYVHPNDAGHDHIGRYSASMRRGLLL